jgi:ribonuclease BN (tRNA processing enzyme)
VNGVARHNTSLFLETGPDIARQGVMVDCNGVAVQRLRAAGVGFDDLAHIFLTHEHIDHIAALVNFVHQSWVSGCLYRGELKRRTHALNIHANAPTLATVQALLAAVKLPAHPHMFPFAFHELDEAGGTVHAGDVTLQYFPVNHGGTPCFGLYADGSSRRLVYSADTEPVPAIYAHLRAGDVLVHDCNKIDQPRNPEHTTWAEIEGLLPTLPPGVTTYLVHLPPMDSAREEAFTRAVAAAHGDRVVVGRDGMSFIL